MSSPGLRTDLVTAGWLPDDFRIRGGGIGTLARIDLSTIIVAGAAGVAAVLAFETRRARRSASRSP